MYLHVWISLHRLLQFTSVCNFALTTHLAITHYFPKHCHLTKLVDFPQFLVSSTFSFLYLHNRRPLHGTTHSINSPVSVTFPYLPSLPLCNSHSSSSNLCHLYPSSIHSLLYKTSSLCLRPLVSCTCMSANLFITSFNATVSIYYFTKHCHFAKLVDFSAISCVFDF